MLIDMDMNEVDSMNIRIVIEMPTVMDIVRFAAQYNLDSLGYTYHWRLDTSNLERQNLNRGAILDVRIATPYSAHLPMIATMHDKVSEQDHCSMMVYIADERDDPAHAIAGWHYFNIEASDRLMFNVSEAV